MPLVASLCIPCITRLDTENNDTENNDENNDKFEVVIEGLASGIYLGLLMLFMIPETIDDFGEVWSSKIKEPLTIYTMALSSICLGLFLVAIVEYIAAKASCCVRAQSTVWPADQQPSQPTVQTAAEPTCQPANESSTAQTLQARDDENPETEARSLIENRPDDSQANRQVESTIDCQECVTQKNKMKINEVWSLFITFIIHFHLCVPLGYYQFFKLSSL